MYLLFDKTVTCNYAYLSCGRNVLSSLWLDYIPFFFSVLSVGRIYERDNCFEMGLACSIWPHIVDHLLGSEIGLSLSYQLFESDF